IQPASQPFKHAYIQIHHEGLISFICSRLSVFVAVSIDVFSFSSTSSYSFFYLSACSSLRVFISVSLSLLSVRPSVCLSLLFCKCPILILITAVLYSAPSRKSTQERSQPNPGQTMWS